MSKLNNKLHILILQHPQEKKKELSSAPLLLSRLENITIKPTLSTPNLSRALGRNAEPSKWAVLFLGTKKSSENLNEVFNLVDRNNRVLNYKETPLEGIVVLDGNWKQSKTLWWRNSWLLRLKRIVLKPELKSAYGKLRKEPRKECLSTLESISLILDTLETDLNAGTALNNDFKEFLQTKKTATNIEPPFVQL